jgi:hypothetical protein
MGEEMQSVNASGRDDLRAIRTDDPELGEPPALAFCCPICAVMNFGLARRRRTRRSLWGRDVDPAPKDQWIDYGLTRPK